jgi:hypothetical protein
MWDHAAYEALAKRSFGVPALVVDSVIDGIVAFETDYAGQAIRELGYIWVDLSGMAHVMDAEGNEIATAYGE